jgi:hypothetical protein
MEKSPAYIDWLTVVNTHRHRERERKRNDDKQYVKKKSIILLMTTTTATLVLTIWIVAMAMSMSIVSERDMSFFSCVTYSTDHYIPIFFFCIHITLSFLICIYTHLYIEWSYIFVLERTSKRVKVSHSYDRIYIHRLIEKKNQSWRHNINVQQIDH